MSRDTHMLGRRHTLRCLMAWPSLSEGYISSYMIYRIILYDDKYHLT